MGEELLQARLPAPQDGEAEIDVRQDGRHRLGEEVEPLLRRQPRYDPDGRHLATVGEAEPGEEDLLVLLLGGEIARPVAERDIAVRLRAPFVVVDAVQDPDQARAPCPEYLVEPGAVLGGLDLAGIGGTDRRQSVGIKDAVEEEIEALLLELVLMKQREIRAKPGVGKDVRAEDPLVVEVVDGEQRLGLRERRLPGEAGPQHQRDEAGLPVVAVDDVGRELQADRALQRGAREQKESQVLVGIGGVDWLPAVQGGAVNEIGVLPRCAEEGEAVGVVAEMDDVLGKDFLKIMRLRAHPRVEGQERPDVVPVLAQLLGERPRHVGEAPGLGPGGDFGGDEEDVHFAWQAATSCSVRAAIRQLT